MLPHPIPEVKPCSQVKGRLILQHTEEKIKKVYTDMCASGAVDRVGFILGANLSRFAHLAMERSDHVSAKRGGDLGWIGRLRSEPRFEEVAFITPKGACTPPFRAEGGFRLFYCEERKG